MEAVEVAQEKKPMRGQHEAVVQCQLNVGMDTLHPLRGMTRRAPSAQRLFDSTLNNSSCAQT